MIPANLTRPHTAPPVSAPVDRRRLITFAWAIIDGAVLLVAIATLFVALAVLS